MFLEIKESAKILQESLLDVTNIYSQQRENTGSCIYIVESEISYNFAHLSDK